MYCKKIELVIDGTIVDIANVNRARTQMIRRVRGKVWWAKRRRKIVSLTIYKTVLATVYGSIGVAIVQGILGFCWLQNSWH